MFDGISTFIDKARCIKGSLCDSFQNWLQTKETKVGKGRHRERENGMEKNTLDFNEWRTMQTKSGKIHYIQMYANFDFSPVKSNPIWCLSCKCNNVCTLPSYSRFSIFPCRASTTKERDRHGHEQWTSTCYFFYFSFFLIPFLYSLFSLSFKVLPTL